MRNAFFFWLTIWSGACCLLYSQLRHRIHDCDVSVDARILASASLLALAASAASLLCSSLSLLSVCSAATWTAKGDAELCSAPVLGDATSPELWHLQSASHSERHIDLEEVLHAHPSIACPSPPVPRILHPHLLLEAQLFPLSSNSTADNSSNLTIASFDSRGIDRRLMSAMATLSYALRGSVKERALFFMFCRVILSVIQCSNVKPVLVLWSHCLNSSCLSSLLAGKLNWFDSSQHQTYMQSAAPVKHWTERTDTTVGIFPPSGLCSRRLCSPPHTGQLLRGKVWKQCNDT